MGDNSPLVSSISAHLLSKALAILCSTLSFLECSCKNLYEKIEVVSLLGARQICLLSNIMKNKGQACLLAITKYLSSLNSKFLSHNPTYCLCSCHLIHFTYSCGNCGLGKHHRDADTLATATVVCNNTPFVSDPGVLS